MRFAFINGKMTTFANRVVKYFIRLNKQINLPGEVEINGHI